MGNRSGIAARASAQRAPDGQEFLAPLAAHRFAIEAAISSERWAMASPVEAIAAAGSRCAPPGLGNDLVDHPESDHVLAVIFMLVAASCALAVSRHRMEAAPSGEMTLYIACSSISTRLAVASAMAPPEPPSPMMTATLARRAQDWPGRTSDRLGLTAFLRADTRIGPRRCPPATGQVYRSGRRAASAARPSDSPQAAPFRNCA